MGGLWLPAVMPVPVVAAAGESLTASVPPPAVYGYTPEQHVGTRRNRPREKSGNLNIQTQINRVKAERRRHLKKKKKVY